jgi:sn-glycerol 3-phosphate transport system substrate-binding protein
MSNWQESVRKAWPLLVTFGLLLALAACGGGGEEDGGEGTATPDGATTTVSSATPTATGGTVEITMWHDNVAATLNAIEGLVRRYNSSQSEVKVKLAFQGTDVEEMAKLVTSLGGGELPNIVQESEAFGQRLIDTGAIAPMQEFIDRENYDLSDLNQNAVQYFTLDGKLWAMPFGMAVPLLFYNKMTFREVGLDPEKPPQDIEEVRQVSEKMLKRDTHGNVTRTGIALDIYGWYLEFVLSEHGDLYANNENGRAGRATEVLFNGPTGQTYFQWWHDMVEEDLAIDVGLALNSPDAILAVGAGQAAMTRSSTAVLRSVVDALEGGLAQTEVEPGLAALAGVPGGTGYTAVYTRGLWIPKDLPEAEQEAGWKFIKWLMEPEQQAEWFAGSGYLPVRNSSYDLPAAQEIMAKYPEFRTGVEIFRSSPVTPATLGPTLGPLKEVREAVLRQLQETIVNGKDPIQAINDAAEEANQAIEEYNRRVE